MKKFVLVLLLGLFGLVTYSIFCDGTFNLSSLQNCVSGLISGFGNRSQYKKSVEAKSFGGQLARCQGCYMPPNMGAQVSRGGIASNTTYAPAKAQALTVASSSTSSNSTTEAETSVTTTNFLQSVTEQAVETPVRFSFTYNNNGTLSTRQVFVVVPDGFTDSNESYPLCFGFHGTSGPGTLAAKNLAASETGSGFIMIAPAGGLTSDGTRSSWNANGSTTEDDLAFVQSMWNAIKSDSRISQNEVYAYGHSVGSLFVSNKLAPNMSNFRGFCCYSSQLMVETDITNAPAPVNIVDFHGEVDPLIPSEEQGSVSFDSTLILYSEEETVQMWSQHNGCSGDVSTETNDTYTLYNSPCANSVVAAYIFKGVAHSSVGPVTEYFGVTPAQLAQKLFADV